MIPLRVTADLQHTFKAIRRGTFFFFFPFVNVIQTEYLNVCWLKERKKEKKKERKARQSGPGRTIYVTPAEVPLQLKIQTHRAAACLLFTCRALPGARTQGARFSSPAAADRKLAIREDREDKPKLHTVFNLLENHIPGPARTLLCRQQ